MLKEKCKVMSNYTLLVELNVVNCAYESFMIYYWTHETRLEVFNKALLN